MRECPFRVRLSHKPRASSIGPFYVLGGRSRDADVSLDAAVPSASAAVRSWSVFTGPPAACGDRLYATASLATAPPARRRRHVTPRRRCEAALVVAAVFALLLLSLALALIGWGHN